jgi:hypothetical protein
MLQMEATGIQEEEEVYIYICVCNKSSAFHTITFTAPSNNLYPITNSKNPSSDIY